MARARKLCSNEDCAELQPCPTHQRKPWVRSTHSARSTLSGSAQQRRAQLILRRDDTCHVCSMQGANQVDHVIPLSQGGADDHTNLKPIHSEPCHRVKSAAEAAHGRRSDR